MNTSGPFTKSELDYLRARVSYAAETGDPYARDVARLIAMIDARDAIAKVLHATIEALREVCLNWGSDSAELDEWVREAVAEKMSEKKP